MRQSNRKKLLDAIEHEQLDVAAKLLKKKINLNKPIEDKSYLLSAIKTGNIKLIKLLLNYGANPNLINIQNKIIKKAIKQGKTIFTLLEKYGLQYQEDINIWFQWGIYYGNVELTKYFIDKGANPQTHKEGYSPIRAAIKGKNLFILNLLIKHHCFDDELLKNDYFSDTHLLEDALKSGDYQIYSMLLHSDLLTKIRMSANDVHNLFIDAIDQNQPMMALALAHKMGNSFVPKVYHDIVEKLTDKQWNRIFRRFKNNTLEKDHNYTQSGLFQKINKNHKLAAPILFAYFDDEIILSYKDILGPIIGITHCTSWGPTLRLSLERCGVITIFIDELDNPNCISLLDGIAIPGSPEQVPDAYFTNTPNPTLSSHIPPNRRNKPADEALKYIQQAKQLGMPVLGLCWGMHLMWVSENGRLTKVDNHHNHPMMANFIGHSNMIEQINQNLAEQRFKITDDANRRRLANSHHYQAVDQSSVPSTLRITSQADDGVVMSFESKDPRLPFYSGIQDHPERTLHDPHNKAMIMSFVAAVKAFHARRDTVLKMPNKAQEYKHKNMLEEMKSMHFSLQRIKAAKAKPVVARHSVKVKLKRVRRP